MSAAVQIKPVAADGQVNGLAGYQCLRNVMVQPLGSSANAKSVPAGA